MQRDYINMYQKEEKGMSNETKSTIKWALAALVCTFIVVWMAAPYLLA